MKMVIEIPNDVKAIIDRKGTNEIVAETLWQAVKNGTPLPKGHGRLVDADKIQSEFVCTHNGDFECVSSRPCSKCPDSQCYMDIESAPTIIEADKER